MLLGANVQNEMLLNLTGGIPVRTALFDLEHNFRAALLEEDMSKVIVVPSNWEEMDLETLKFVMAHEVAHHELDHVGPDKIPDGTGVEAAKKGLWIEFEADERAAEMVGRKAALNGLIGTVKWFKRYGYFVNIQMVTATLGIRMLAIMSASKRWKEAVLWVAFLGAREQ